MRKSIRMLNYSRKLWAKFTKVNTFFLFFFNFFWLRMVSQILIYFVGNILNNTLCFSHNIFYGSHWPFNWHWIEPSSSFCESISYPCPPEKDIHPCILTVVPTEVCSVVCSVVIPGNSKQMAECRHPWFLQWSNLLCFSICSRSFDSRPPDALVF